MPYEKSPQNCSEIKLAFANPNILQELGTSLHREHGQIFNHVHEESEFAYCVLSSPKSIRLILDNLKEEERFYLCDATFSITPMCNVFHQTLLIYAQFGIKVSF